MPGDRCDYCISGRELVLLILGFYSYGGYLEIVVDWILVVVLCLASG